MSVSKAVQVEFFGPFAVFTRPETPVERMTYDVPTPSALRGMLSAIYAKKTEFYYEITKIEVLKPVRRLVMLHNEVTSKVNPKDILAHKAVCGPGPDKHTQRATTYLVDVHYRVTANIVMQPGKDALLNAVVAQFNRRVTNGQCFRQPYFGISECLAYFKPVDLSVSPVDLTTDLGYMLYDMFDPSTTVVLDTELGNQDEVLCRTFFRAIMYHGVVEVPRWGSDAILPDRRTANFE